ncbi:MAG TPA: Type 1 glutamine amidotransferase-like domain-containing protein [Allosphingosinicella sp.]|nr:Type 1 glutamine amidotransferase-like domain-containing protein [Allosphingosinicella sp.]
MKLYLSSLMVGDHVDRLIALAGGRGARMAVITNALDYIPLQAQLEHARAHFDPMIYFADNGFDPSLLDLRFYFGRPAALRAVLLRHKVIWALGGNAFLLRRALRESGFDNIIGDLLGEGIIYAGWSAGACVAGDSLRAIGLMDDPSVSAPGYDSAEPIWDGLGLVPFTIIPHYRSEHPEAPAAGKAAEFALSNGIDFRTLSDGDVLLLAENGVPTLLSRRRGSDTEGAA